jgi:hypothetical protein
LVQTFQSIPTCTVMAISAYQSSQRIGPLRSLSSQCASVLFLCSAVVRRRYGVNMSFSGSLKYTPGLTYCIWVLAQKLWRVNHNSMRTVDSGQIWDSRLKLHRNSVMKILSVKS